MENEQLVKISKDAVKRAYAPYSNFRVGAALITDNGKIYTGVNVENASYGATVCAERTAILKAVSEGDTVIKAIAISSDSEKFIYPCGICRQVFEEFFQEDTKIICSDRTGSCEVYTLDSLLPKAFKKRYH